jgi:hypothetical protein
MFNILFIYLFMFMYQLISSFLFVWCVVYPEYVRVDWFNMVFWFESFLFCSRFVSWCCFCVILMLFLFIITIIYSWSVWFEYFDFQWQNNLCCWNFLCCMFVFCPQFLRHWRWVNRKRNILCRHEIDIKLNILHWNRLKYWTDNNKNTNVKNNETKKQN